MPKKSEGHTYDVHFKSVSAAILQNYFRVVVKGLTNVVFMNSEDDDDVEEEEDEEELKSDDDIHNAGGSRETVTKWVVCSG